MVASLQHIQQGKASLQRWWTQATSVLSMAPTLPMAEETAQTANFFILQCVEAARRMHLQGKFYWCEHPEDLCKTKSGDTPASIWQFPSMRALADLTSAASWAIHQRTYGAPTSKPTRLMSNSPACQQFGQQWPTFDADGFCTGPLGHCPRDFHAPLLGFNVQMQKWNTADSAAYPAAMWESIALDVISALPLCMAMQGDMLQLQPNQRRKGRTKLCRALQQHRHKRKRNNRCRAL